MGPIRARRRSAPDGDLSFMPSSKDRVEGVDQSRAVIRLVISGERVSQGAKHETR